MKITNKQLINLIKNITVPQPNEFATLLLLKKQEDFIRNLLFMKFESEYIYNNSVFPYPDWKPRSYVKHDCVLLTYSHEQITPLSIMELKFAHSSFILEKQNEPINKETQKQDSVWLEGFTSKSRKSGIKADLDRMFKTVKDTYEKLNFIPSIHQILVIAVPREKINVHNLPIHVDYANHNSYLGHYNNNSDLYIKEIKAILTKQLNLIKNTYFRNIKFESDFCTLPIGKAFQKYNVDLLFFVVTPDIMNAVLTL